MRRLTYMRIDANTLDECLKMFTKRMSTYDIQESDVVSVAVKEGAPREVKDPIEGRTTIRGVETTVFYWTSN